ncbi:MAG: ABC transporter ATP-binding protein, partial [Desulfobacterales bacterium]|nr:ABC transporter ATP-binding protein [Desulfobacterales bacterium]
ADMLARVGIPDPETRLGQYPHEFSGGMRQRICIAMALLSDPSLIIADEPTTALDVTLEAQIVHLLRELQEEMGCSIICVSHHLGMIAELCHEVVVMYAGEILEQGSVQDIFKRPAHPYTRRLLACDPANIREKSKNLPTIQGEIPDLIRLPQGCIFHDRCPERLANCASEAPGMTALDAGHRAACHLLWEEGGKHV